MLTTSSAAAEVPVPDAIPDLWRANEDAVRLYQLYLCRLQINDMHERIVAACHQIRRYAARGPGPTEGLFTFSIEIESLGESKGGIKGGNQRGHSRMARR
jgi:hypothetical protein